MLYPHQKKLRAALLAVVNATLISLSASAQSTAVQQAAPASAKPSQEPKVLTLSDEGVVRAEELCTHGDALSKQGDTRGALDALGDAVERYKRIYLNERSAPPPFASDASARFRSGMSARLRRAPECIELYTRLGGVRSMKDFERSQLEALRAHALGLTETDASRIIFFSRETDERAVITSKPEPRFPREARGTTVSIRVLVRVVLGADGEVRHAFVLTEQAKPFSESSVEATKGIKFTPARKDGHTVSQFVTLEYGFQSY